jgi:hypothetical protein
MGDGSLDQSRHQPRYGAGNTRDDANDPHGPFGAVCSVA